MLQIDLIFSTVHIFWFLMGYSQTKNYTETHNQFIICKHWLQIHWENLSWIRTVSLLYGCHHDTRVTPMSAAVTLYKDSSGMVTPKVSR